MSPDELVRKISQNVVHQPEADWAGRIIPSRGEIERAIHREPQTLSKRELRRIEKQRSRGIERG